ncbi:MAG: RrF2 family transcriptional regulator [Bacteroidia bacterium]
MISKSCKYAIRAVAFVASKPGTKLGVKDIAQEIDAPEAFTAKVLLNLSKHRVISSLKGPYGGFFIDERQIELPLIDVVNAIDGLSIFSECGMGLKQCSDIHPCPMHNAYKVIRDGMHNFFKHTTIKQLAENLKTGPSYLKNDFTSI